MRPMRGTAPGPSRGESQRPEASPPTQSEDCWSGSVYGEGRTLRKPGAGARPVLISPKSSLLTGPAGIAGRGAQGSAP
jgi:hypothetical protein